MDAVQHHIEVQVLEAKEIAAKHSDGTSEPYVKLKVDGHTFRTHSVHKTLAPKWNETFFINVKEPLKDLELVVKDKTKITAPFIGKVKVSLKTVKEKGKIADWFSLRPKTEGEAAHGSIHLEIAYKDGKAPDDPEHPSTLKGIGNFFHVSTHHEGKKDTSNPSSANSSRSSFTDKTVESAHSEPKVTEPAHTTKQDITSSTEKTSKHSRKPSRSDNSPVEGRHNPLAKLKPELEFLKESLSISKKAETIEKDQPDIITVNVEFEGKVNQISIETADAVLQTMVKIGESFHMPESAVASYDVFLKTPNKSKLKLLNKSKTIRYYRVPEKGFLVIKKSITKISPRRKEVPPIQFVTMQEKFNLVPSRNDNDVLYELACHVANYPISGSAEPAKPSLLSMIQSKLQVPEEVAQSIHQRVKEYGPSAESLLVELYNRLCMLDKHPFYSKNEFEDPKGFDYWKEQEQAAVKEFMRDLVFNEKWFYALLTVNVIEASNVPAMDLSGTSDPYCKLSCEGNEVTTSIIWKTLNPVWNETLAFEIANPASELKIEVWDYDYASSDDFIATIYIPLSTLVELPTVNKWYDLGEGKGKIHLEFKYDYRFAKYYRAAINLSNVSVPAPEFQQPYVPNYNVLYEKLERALLVESKEEHFSADSEWLLGQYANRFGVRSIYVSLTRLLHLASLIKPTLRSLSTIEELFTDMYRAMQSGEKMTKQEQALFFQIKEQLGPQLKYFLSKYKDIFPKNSPAGAISSMLDIITHLNNEENKQSYDMILHTLQSSAQYYFDLLVERTKESNVIETQYTDVELLKICAGVEQEIKKDLDFKDTFMRFKIDLVSECALVYYKALAPMIQEFSAKANLASEKAFDLLGSLRNVHKTLLSATKKDATYFGLLPLEQLFAPFVYNYLKITKEKLLEWGKKAISIDKKIHVSNEVRHSESIIDLFDSIAQSLDWITRLDMKDPFIIIQFAEIMADAVDNYTNLESADVAKALELTPKSKRKEEKKALTNLVPKKITPELCVEMNNIESSRDQMDKMATSLESLLGEALQVHPAATETVKSSLDLSLRRVFGDVKAQINRIVQILQKTMNTFIVFKLVAAIQEKMSHDESKEKGELKQLYDYLDDQLAVLYENLYPNLFKKVLQALWSGIILDLKSTLLPTIENRTRVSVDIQHAKSLDATLDELDDYFYCDGSGLDQDYIKQQEKPLRKLLALCELPTADLVKKYKEASLPEYKDDDVKAADIKRLLMLRGSDKEAMSFIKDQDANSSAQNDTQKIRENFLLPDSEIIVDDYKVTSMDGFSGYIYLSSNYLLFDSSPMQGPDGPAQIAIPLKDIKSITRENYRFVLDLVRVETNNEKYEFTSFKNRTIMIQDIIAQAKKAGNIKL